MFLAKKCTFIAFLMAWSCTQTKENKIDAEVDKVFHFSLKSQLFLVFLNRYFISNLVRAKCLFALYLLYYTIHINNNDTKESECIL